MMGQATHEAEYCFTHGICAEVGTPPMYGRTVNAVINELEDLVGHHFIGICLQEVRPSPVF